MKHRLVVPLVLCLGAVGACSATDPSSPPRPKLVILGFDGLDPDLVAKWMEQGKLPNMKEIAGRGAMRDLETTPAPESAAAWASFATGMNPGKHNIYELLVRDPQTYMPRAGMMQEEPARFLLDAVPIAGPKLTSLRAGTSFWVHAGRAGVRSSILTVPLTFPPEEVPAGELLAGFPMPDLLGTRGTYYFFATDAAPAQEGATEFGGIVKRLVFDGETARTELPGPANPIVGQQLRELRANAAPTDADRAEMVALEAREDLRIPVVIHWNKTGRSATIEIGDHSVLLREGEWSKWIDLDFHANYIVRLHGMAQLYLVRAGDELQLYVSPLNWKPDRPPAPMSSPARLAADLFERLGYYRTLGWAEATGPLNEGRIDEKAFMDDLYRAFDDRAQVILQRIDTRQWDLLVGVVESTDRVQHMMWRMTDTAHPMYDKAAAAAFGDAIERVYRRADELVGEVRARLEPGTTILIVSDHGFHSFRQSVNLNSWLVQEGFMTLRDRPVVETEAGDGSRAPGAFWKNVDWSRTRAYAVGLGQIYLNLKGREANGVVSPGAEANAVQADLAARLLAFQDAKTRQPVVDAVYKAADIYSGPFVGEAADLQVGLAEGYRVSSETAIGGSTPGIIQPNMTKWSGDHGSSDFKSTAGTLISSRPLVSGASRIVDIAPTVLKYFNVPIPTEIDGRPLF